MRSENKVMLTKTDKKRTKKIEYYTTVLRNLSSIQAEISIYQEIGEIEKLNSSIILLQDVLEQFLNDRNIKEIEEEVYYVTENISDLRLYYKNLSEVSDSMDSLLEKVEKILKELATEK